MSQRDKDNTINKLKQFFRNVKTPSGMHNQIATTGHITEHVHTSFSGPNRDKTDMEILRELEAVLQPQIPVAQRCKALKELCESDKINRLEDVSTTNIWFKCNIFNVRVLFRIDYRPPLSACGSSQRIWSFPIGQPISDTLPLHSIKSSYKVNTKACRLCARYFSKSFNNTMSQRTLRIDWNCWKHWPTLAKISKISKRILVNLCCRGFPMYSWPILRSHFWRFSTISFGSMHHIWIRILWRALLSMCDTVDSWPMTVCSRMM